MQNLPTQQQLHDSLDVDGDDEEPPDLRVVQFSDDAGESATTSASSSSHHHHHRHHSLSAGLSYVWHHTLGKYHHDDDAHHLRHRRHALKHSEVPSTPNLRSSIEMRRPLPGQEEEEERRAEKRKRDKEKEEDGEGKELTVDTSGVLKSEGLSSAQAAALLEEHGRNELPEKVVPRWLIFVRLLIAPLPVMIWIAAVVEVAIGNYIDTGILVAINFLNATLSYLETTKAGDAVAALKASMQPTAAVKRDGEWNFGFDAALLVPGDLVQLNSGSAVPADCMINEDTSIDVDESAMTGESLPVALHERDLAKMGGTVVRGEAEATVVFTGAETFFGKTAAMLADDGERSNLDKLLLRIVIVLVAFSLVLSGTAFGYLLGTGENVTEALSFAVVLIVSSIPMAIEIVTLTTLAIGSRGMAKFGAIVQRLSAIEDLAGLSMLCSDKTGTLTRNKMVIQDETPVFEADIDQMALLRYAALAARYDQPPGDALDTLVLRCHLWCKVLHDFELEACGNTQGRVSDARASMAVGELPTPSVAAAPPRAADPNDHAAELMPRRSMAHPEHPSGFKDERDIERWNDEHVFASLLEALDDYEQLEFVPFDPRTKRTEATIRRKSTGQVFKVSKGAPHVLTALDRDAAKAAEIDAAVTELGADGVRAMAVAITDPIEGEREHHRQGDTDNDDDDDDESVDSDLEAEPAYRWHVLGLLTFLDPPRFDTHETILRSQAYGVPVRMITGDHVLIARKTARDLEMGDRSKPDWPRIYGPEKLPVLDAKGNAPPDLVSRYGDLIRNADGFAQVHPEHKFLIVQTYRELGYKTGMTGDGVNDAPALKRADVGIAVAGATDAARGAADIVLTREGLSTIVLGMEIARVIFARMQSFLTYRIGASMQLLFFFFIAVFAFPPEQFLPSPPPSELDDPVWPSFFQLPVIYLLIITVINDGTLIAIGYDHATPSHEPSVWNLRILFLISSVLGLVSCLSSLLLLYFCVDSWQDGSLFQLIGIGGIQYGHIICMLFLKVAVSDVLTLLTSRTGSHFFWHRRPHWILVVATSTALLITTLLSLLWPCGELDGIPVCGLVYESGIWLAVGVWIYCLCAFVCQDALKVGVYAALHRWNVFNVNAVVKIHDAKHVPPMDGVAIVRDSI